ncbi:MAG TPA: iron ABC transporter permease [Stellaceae bacterium]|nr:iron ABC transporter permease [Stellaceae bacterium]
MAAALTPNATAPKVKPWLLRTVGKLRDPATLIITVAVLTTSFLVLYPVFWLFYGAFIYGQGGFAQALNEFWHMPGLARAFWNTLIIMIGTVPAAFLIAMPLVWITSRTNTPLRGVIELAALLPFITPPLIGAVAWSLLAAPRTGVINEVARYLGAHGPVTNIYSMPGLIFVMGLYLSPYVFLTVKAVMDRMDASLEEASLIAGGGIWRTMRHIVLPICMPGILSAAILVFTRALEEFAIPGILGTPSGIYTITTYIFYQAISYTPPRYEIAALLASFIMAATGIGLWLQARLLGGRQKFTTISGKGHPPRRMKLGIWRYVTLAYALTYILLAVVLPYAVLIYAAFIRRWGETPSLANLTLRHFAATFSPDLDAASGFTHSLILALGGATLATLLTLLVSFVIVRARAFAGQVLDILTSIPLMMPGPVMAVAMLWAYIHPPFQLYGTLWILLLAYMTHYIPYGVRTIGSSVRQVSVEFERAASVCGANEIASFRDVLFPLVRSGVLAGWMLMFVSMIRELSASIFLFVPGTETISVSLVERWQEADFSSVAVLSLTLVAVSLTVIIIVRRLFGRSATHFER